MTRTNEPGRTGARTSRAEQERVLVDLDRSGVSVVEFARSQGIPPETLYRWSCRRRKRMANTIPPIQKPKPAQFVELDLIGRSKPEPLIVHLGSKVRAEVRSIEHLNWVARLGQQLAQETC